MTKTISRLATLLATALLATACENDNINPYDYAGSDNGAGTEQGSTDVVKTALAEYPKGSVVWTHDTTLTESVEIAKGASLYIEPGVTVTCKSEVQVPVEIVVLGNLYCMGTAEKPVVFTSDTKKPADWGGIICGYNSQEVVLSHVDLAYAGATPTESSPSFQNKLYKTSVEDGLPAFFFCNTNGSFVMTGCFFHDNYNDQTYLSGGQAVIYDNILADSGNAANGGEGINIKAGCKMDVANNLLYNICTNGFKLSNAGNSESVPLSQFVAYNNTIVDCGWRRSKNKKGGSVWLEKAIAPTFVGNLIYDCRFGMKQPAKNGGDIAHSVIAPNYYFASTETGVKQMSRDADMAVWSDLDIKSATAGDKDPLFTDFKQNPKMNINCEIDDPEKGAPLPFDRSWSFRLKAGSPALTGAPVDVQQVFPKGLAFIGMKKVIFNNTNEDQDYRFCAPAPVARFGAKL